MKKILLPTDFSDNAWNAIFTAIKIYNSVPCQFYLLNAYEPDALNLLGKKTQQRLGVIYDSLAQYSQQELDKVLAYLHQNHPNPKHRFETISKSDTLVNAVKEMVLKHDIDLIIMGTQGATGAKEIFIGSNTVEVLKNCTGCTMMAVPSTYNFQSFKTMVFPTDFTRSYRKQQLSPIIELATLWKSKILVLHVALEFVLSDIQKANKEILKARFLNLAYDFQNVEMEVNVAKTIENYVANTRADLMAIIWRQHTFWENIIGETVVKKIVFHTDVPLLVLPE
ncbi:MAG: universal stress protein [Maribacter sp.]|nr:universal stress protein [Maribacter sp.]